MSSAETSSHSDDQGPSPETPAPDLASPEIFTLVDPPGAGLINPQPGPVDTVEVAAGHFRRSPGILESGHFQLAPHTVEQGHFPDLPHTVGPAAIVANILGQSLAVATGDRAAASVRQNYDCDYDNNKTMAPVKDTSNVHMTIKDIIQHLSEIQIQTHGYVPETQDLMVDKMTDLAQSLARLQSLTSPTASPNNHIHDIQIAPEIVDYVDDGRNPDIFTRDFVENVQRGNAVINGKQQAFRDFTEIYAKALKEGVPGVSRQVDRVLENAGFQTDHGDDANGSKALNS